MTLTARSQHPDHALRENAEQRAHRGTHLAADVPADALFVERGSGALGDGQGALSVRAGTALVDGTEHTLDADAAIDIAGGDGDPRRDVVYLAPTDVAPSDEQQVTTGDGAALAVREGDPNPLAWDSALDDSDETITNAYRPAPPDFADAVGLPLAVVTVTANAGTLPVGALTELRATAPSAADTPTASALNAADYGAVGDGATDDTQALRDAITAAQSTGVPLDIPDGRYLVSGGLDIDDATVRGSGRGTVLSVDGALTTAVTITGPGGELSDLRIEGNDNCPEGVRVKADDTAVKRVWCRAFSDAGFDQSAGGINLINATVDITGCVVEDVQAPDSTLARGIRCTGFNGGHVTIRNCRIDGIREQADGDGITLQTQGMTAQVDNCRITDCAKAGIKVGNNAAGVTISATSIGEMPPDAEALIRVQAPGTVLVGNTLRTDSVQGGALVLQDGTATGSVALGNTIEFTDPTAATRGIYDTQATAALSLLGNTVRMGGGGDHAVMLDGVTNAAVGLNTVVNAGSDALNFGAGSSAIVGLNVLDATGAAIGGDLADVTIGQNIGHQREAFRHPDGDVYGGLRAATPHAASGSGDVYLDDGTNNGGAPSWMLDDPDTTAWVAI